MSILIRMAACIALAATALPAVAQEIVVTSQRRGYNQGDASYTNGVVATSRPIINLKRMADYAVIGVRLVGDERDMTKRRAELRATIRNMMAGAGKAGVELSIGDYVIEPLTLTNYEGLPFGSDGRQDTDVNSFLVKVRLTPGMTLAAARAQVERFIAGVAKVGRTTVSSNGETTLSVIDPDQYRGAIIDLIAEDAAISAGKFGQGSGVDVTGLDRPVEWARGGSTEVFLFLPASYVVRKK